MDSAGQFATVGMGANLDATVAARRAALEVGQVRPAFFGEAVPDHRRSADPRTHRRIPRRVTKMEEDHALLYADPCMASAFPVSRRRESTRVARAPAPRCVGRASATAAALWRWWTRRALREPDAARPRAPRIARRARHPSGVPTDLVWRRRASYGRTAGVRRAGALRPE